METESLTDEIWTGLPGSSTDLAGGTVYYQLEGPEDGELVVLVHGMTIPSFVWDPTWAMLLEEGYRVLRYDLFGRGYSDRPHVDHTLDLYTRQLTELLQALKLSSQRLNLVGYSLGAAICAAFALENADLVHRICFIEPAHPEDMPNPPSKIWKIASRIRFLAAVVDQSLLDSLPKNFYKYEDFPDFEDQFRTQISYKGFARSLLSTMIDFDYAQLSEIYLQLGELNKPVCLIWGAEDQLALPETSALFKELIPALEYHEIEEAGHVVHYERPDLANPILLEFLKVEV